MIKKLLPFVAVSAMLVMPTAQAWAADGPTPPPDNTQMDMSSSQMAMSQPQMSGWDMIKMRTTAKMRAKAARNAKLKGKPAQVGSSVSMADVEANGPDYFGSTGNFANSDLPRVTWRKDYAGHKAGDPTVLPAYDPTTKLLNDPITNAVVLPADSPYQVDQKTGKVVMDPINDIPQLDFGKVDLAGGIRKFVKELPVAGYIPIATPDQTTYPGSDYYVIGLKDYYQSFNPDIPDTKLRGYYQINGGPKNDTAQKPFYLGPLIIAQSNRPVRVKFINQLPTGDGGNLFIPTDTTAMGAGVGPDGVTPYQQNRAAVHLHGGLTPWISDGTPHQWTTPVGDTTKYPKGVAVYGVPDMPAIHTVNTDGTAKAGDSASDGTITFYYTNQQSARLMWYHDHAYGLTRLNVYVGEAGGYLLQDEYSKNLEATPNPTDPQGQPVLPDGEGTALILQDKGFVPDDIPSGYFPDGQLTDQDPTWKLGEKSNGWGGVGQLWFPHTYMPNQNPYDNSGANAMGRWDYGPWFWPIFGTAAGLLHGEIPNPWASADRPWEPPFIPGTPSNYTFAKGLATSNASLIPEGFVDTPLVNGIAYPYMTVDPKAYRFRILNAANDRYFNLQMYCSAADMPNASGAGLYKVIDGRDMWKGASRIPQNAAAGEVPMVPAEDTPGFPADYPVDSRAGGVPDPAAAAGDFLQIGTEGGVLPNAVDVRNGPVGFDYNRRDIVVLNINAMGLNLGPAERVDVVFDFATAANMGCKNVIMYNDEPAPVPAGDPRNDYYTNDPDFTSTGGAPSTLPGYGPNMRTMMQFRINGVTSGVPANVPYWNSQALREAVPAWFATTQHRPIVPNTRYAAAYPKDPIGQSNVYSRISNNSLSWNDSSVGDLSGITLTGAGTGYGPTATVTGGGGGAGAVLVPTLAANGTVRRVTIVNPGAGYTTPPDITIATPVGGVAATATATIRGGVISGVTVTNGGSGYSSGATVTIAAPASGNPGNALATVNLNTGTIGSLSLIDVGDGYDPANPPQVTISAPLYEGGIQATASVTVSNGTAWVTVPAEPKAIQELFEMDYGRMNATMGVELPFTNGTNQTTIPYGYAEPTTEYLYPTQVGTQIGTTRNGTVVWKITHNGVDTHTMHFHLTDVQLINRVGWDGAIRPPDENEMGWKESIRMNPLEDAIVAMRPATPELPFKIGESIRSIDPAMPANHAMSTIDPLTGTATTFSNEPVNMGWEYVWHCHLLGHEENDMMREVDFAGSPAAPSIGTATAGPSYGTSGTVTVTWTNNANWTLTNFVVQRSTTSDFSDATVIQSSSDKPGAWQGRTGLGGVAVIGKATSFVNELSNPDVESEKTFYYRVRAESRNGLSQWSNSVSVVSPKFTSPVPPPPVAPDNVRVTSVARSAGQPAMTIAWSGVQTSVVPGVSYSIRISTSPTFAGTPQIVTVAGNDVGTYSKILRNGLGVSLASGTTYYVQVRAQAIGGFSAWVNSTPMTAVPL